MYSNKSLDELIFGYVNIEAIYLLIKYDVFDYIGKYPEKNLKVIAEEVELDYACLESVVILLHSIDVCRYDGEYVSIAPSHAESLCKGTERSLDQYITFVRNFGVQSIANLEEMLTGKADPSSPYGKLFANDEDNTVFDNAMYQLSKVNLEEVVKLLPTNLKNVIDLGGGSGQLARQILDSKKALSVSVFDLPNVTSSFMAEHSKHPTSGVAFIAGDFFKCKLPKADTYILSYVLSNWNDSQIEELVANIQRSFASPDSHIVVLDRVFDDEGCGPYSTAVMNLNMTLKTEGRHRRYNEYVGIFRRCGMKGAQYIETDVDKKIMIFSSI